MTYIILELASFVYESSCNRTLKNFIANLLILQKYTPTLHAKQVTGIFLSHVTIPHNIVYIQFAMLEHHFGTVFPLILGTNLLSTAFVEA